MNGAPLPFDAVRTVTLDTLDSGPVTFDCPAWCIGHHWQEGAVIGRNDICHRSVRVKAGVVTESRGWVPMLTAWVSWAPFAELVPVISLVVDAEGDYAAEDGQHIAEGLRLAASRIERIAAEALRLRGEIS
ncbi:hypothetical protein [Streptomyces sp. AVP053U2]|uniref:DUF6907 domain-containing protein n=1 Tax=Streptomyces sp. AVP053U2 TaxID=1737066 RepID=UPI00073BF346|nr:hypothetical protein [Streptomyces sp. AVP053U2]ODA75569.1 hypothetical protein APS67_000132 [Streptomyces sp. AVP053U2]